MWRGVQRGVEGYSSLPKSEAPEAGVLIQAPVQYPGSRLTTAGEAWRQVRNNWIIPYGGALLLIMLLALAIFYFAKGPIGHHRPWAAAAGASSASRRSSARRTGPTPSPSACWRISGIVMAFGKFFLLPVMGAHAVRLPHLPAEEPAQLRRAAVRGVAGDRVHHLPRATTCRSKGDLRWLLQGGRHVRQGKAEPPSHRFNAGEKVRVLGRRAVAGHHRRRLGPGDGQADARPRLRARHHAAWRTWSTRWPPC